MQLGGGYSDWTITNTQFADAGITILFVVDVQGSLKPNLVVAFDQVDAPAFSNVALNMTWEGPTPLGDACFTLTNTETNSISEERCLSDVVPTEASAAVRGPWWL